jgi:hypothetical protein
MKDIDYNAPEDVNALVEKCLHEYNHFWWGVVIGLRYGELNRYRVTEGEEPHSQGFKPIVMIRYPSPCVDGTGETKGEIVKWY